mmetsp:Transcript_15597/g.19034  ORF Transcript_15597/g.19034 Transcript_15597/m.19034 type:complete len:104 (+) Transcript_15597:37-348(+)
MDLKKALEAIQGQKGTGIARIVNGQVEIVQATGELSGEEGIETLRQCAYIAVDASNTTSDQIKRITVACDDSYQYRVSQHDDKICVVKVLLSDKDTNGDNSTR